MAFDNYTKTGRFSIQEGNCLIELPVLEQYAPNVHFQAGLIGFEPRTLGSKYTMNAYGYKSISIPVSKEFSRLQVQVVPATDSVTPGSSLSVAVKVSDLLHSPCNNAEGKFTANPLLIQVLLFAVDESVLHTAGYTLLDPLLSFFQSRSSPSSKPFDYYSHIAIRHIPEDIPDSVVSELNQIKSKLQTALNKLTNQGNIPPIGAIVTS